MRTRHEAAYEAGRTANENGHAVTANPFNLLGDMRAAWWSNGWLDQQAVREEWEGLFDIKASPDCPLCDGSGFMFNAPCLAGACAYLDGAA